MFRSILVRTGIRLTGRRIIGSFISLVIIWITLDLLIFNFAGYETISDERVLRANAHVEHLKNKSEDFIHTNIIEHVHQTTPHDMPFESKSKLSPSTEFNLNLRTTHQFTHIELGLTSTTESQINIENAKREHRLDLLHAKLLLQLRQKKENIDQPHKKRGKSLIVKHSDHEGRLNLQINDDNEEVIFDPMSRAVNNIEHPRNEISAKNQKNTAREHEMIFKTLTKHNDLIGEPHQLHQEGIQKQAIEDALSHLSRTNVMHQVVKSTTSLYNVDDRENLRPVLVKDMDIRRNLFHLSDFGENGKAIIVDKSEEELVKETWNLSLFNQYVSDKISFERSIPDVRNPLCKLKTYTYLLLPKTSIIICFTDEAWSTLIRTINSVLNRTPPELLSEILLVDDFSQRDHLKQQLDDYIRDFPIIKLIRLKSRHGLIRARLTAIEQAVGPVITLLDSHVECNKGWLEPLLDSIRRNRRTVIAPIIDVIDEKTFEYVTAPADIRGGFDWSLNFEWNKLPQHEIDRRSDPSAEIRTATTCGGLLSMDKQFFNDLGKYDPDLEVWGAENIEISFKTWMCGGSLEIHPCSRVGHVFREKLPYSMPGKRKSMEVFLRNSKRVAEVWMDDYKELFYKFNPEMRDVDVGDTASRKKTVRQGCNNFQWYLNELYPGRVMPTFFPEAWGLVTNLESGKCMNIGDEMSTLIACEWNPNALYLQLTPHKQIETFIGCIGLVDGVIVRVGCHEKAKILQFNHRKSGDQIIEINTRKCLTPIESTDTDKHVTLELLPCASERLDQKWSFEKYSTSSYQTASSIETTSTNFLSANLIHNVADVNQVDPLQPSSSVNNQAEQNNHSMVKQDSVNSASSTPLASGQEESDIKDTLNKISNLNNAQDRDDFRPIPVKDLDIRRNPYNLSNVGENGDAVVLDEIENSLVAKTWGLAKFNQYVSDKISLERSIPDVRNPLCKLKTYIYPLLPKTSIIICFTDEAWSTLIRTINSVLNRTPPELFTEILLVDDFSQRDHLKQQLDDYIRDFPIIKLIRLKSRHGLIRARLISIEQAVGPVITLLDSHVECNKGWLEPLLDAIRRNRRAIASPIIDVINATSFEYNGASDTISGTFDWGLEFEWTLTMPPREVKRRTDPTTEIHTATVAGGLLSMDKQFFYELGAYDPDLEIWGAENIELSFKTWMCGGSLEIHPCSRVGHVFRDSQPYTIPGKKSSTEVFLRNSKRVAEVWMDDYKKLFYRYNPSMLNVDVGDTSRRNEIKERLQCRNFEWFLNEVSPEVFRPSLFPAAWGFVTNLANGKCLNMLDDSVVLSACEGNPDFTFFQLTTDNKIETFVNCIGLVDDALQAVDCSDLTQVTKFSHRQSGDQIIEMNTNKCLTTRAGTENSHILRLEFLPCASDRIDQKWSFEKYLELSSIKTMH